MTWFGTSMSALRVLEEKGPPRVGLFDPLKRNGELGLERRETVRPLSTVYGDIITCFGTRGTKVLN